MKKTIVTFDGANLSHLFIEAGLRTIKEATSANTTPEGIRLRMSHFQRGPLSATPDDRIAFRFSYFGTTEKETPPTPGLGGPQGSASLPVPLGHFPLSD